MGFVQRICVYNELLYSHCYRNQSLVVSSKIIVIFQCLISSTLEHTSAYYELSSFPDSGMKRALQNLIRRRPVRGEEGGRKVKKNKLAWFPKPLSFFDFLLPGFVVLSRFARVIDILHLSQFFSPQKKLPCKLLDRIRYIVIVRGEISWVHKHHRYNQCVMAV